MLTVLRFGVEPVVALDVSEERQNSSVRVHKPTAKRSWGSVVVVATLAVGLVVTVPLGAAAPAEAASGECAIAPPSSEFTDAVDSSQRHAQVWRLYQAVFLRQPVESGLEYWAGVRASGKSLKDIAKNFTDGPEFQNRYGNLSDLEFVRLVYDNILCRTATDSGEAYWAGLLQSGSLSRHDMVVNFSELREYLRFTGTCHSIYSEETAASDHCIVEGIVPLSTASLAVNGYQAFDKTIGRVSGGSGSFRGVQVDMTRAIGDRIFDAGTERCSVASINANWMSLATKDRAKPDTLGIGVVDGVHTKDSSDRTDRGVFGLRVDANPKTVIQTWPGNPVTDSDTRLNSVMYSDGTIVLEQWQAAAEISPYLLNLEPDQIVGANQWIWAAAGVPLRVSGQDDHNFLSDYSADPYTYQTHNHSFVAVDQDTQRLVFGATSNLDTRDLLTWFRNNGYEDLIKFDGGASTEMNVAGQAVVAGTGRDVPVWLGIGC